jgi:hypothetical protein
MTASGARVLWTVISRTLLLLRLLSSLLSVRVFAGVQPAL